MSDQQQHNFGWSKIRRQGNDEIPVGKDAVKTIRTTPFTDFPASGTPMHVVTKKPIVTKIAKLSYEPKESPRRGVVKSVHTYRGPVEGMSRKSDKEPKLVTEEFVNITSQLPVEANRNVVEDNIKQLSERFEQRKKERLEEFNDIRNALKENFNILGEKSEPVSSHAENTSSEKKEILPPPEQIPNQEELAREYYKTKQYADLAKTQTNQPSHKKYVFKFSSDTNVNQNNNHKMSLKSQSLISLDSGSCKRRSLKSSNTKTLDHKENRPRSLSATSVHAREKQDLSAKTYICGNVKDNVRQQKKKANRTYLDARTKAKQSKAEKDAIKQRLEALKENTRKILVQNIRKARKKTTGRDSDVMKLEPDDKNEKITNCSKSIQDIKPNQRETKTHPLTDSTKFDEPQDHATKKLGLLRMPDGENNSQKSKSDIQSSINSFKSSVSALVDVPPRLEMNKENMRNLENICQVKDSVSISSSKFSAKKDNLQIAESILDLDLEKSISLKPSLEKTEKLKLKNCESLELSIPDVKLKSEILLEDKSTQFETKKDTSSVPYWLKPTSVEPYPYSFIMAVRKKLEAIANPILTSKKTESNKSEKNLNILGTHVPATSNNDLNGRIARQRLSNRTDFKKTTNINDHSSMSLSYPQNKFSTTSTNHSQFVNSTHKNGHSADSFRKKSMEINKTHSKPTDTINSNSEITTDLQSITFEPDANTASEVSSIKSESINPILSSTKISNRHHGSTVNTEDVTTSPERKKLKSQNTDKRGNDVSFGNKYIHQNIDHKLSPLSTEKIDSLTIKSRSIPSSINTSRGESSNWRSSDHTNINKLSDMGSVNQIHSNNIDPDELLNAFNKSLSQVMEVNQQFQSSLHKQIDTNKSRSTTSISNQYSSDFEKSKSLRSQSTHHQPSSSVHSSIHTQGTRELTNSLEERKIAFSRAGTVRTINTSKTSSISTIISDFTTRKNDGGSHPAYTEMLNETMSGTLIETSRSIQKVDENISEELMDSIGKTGRLSRSSEKHLDLEFSKDSLDLLHEKETMESYKPSQRNNNHNITFHRGEMKEKHFSTGTLSKHSKVSCTDSSSDPPPGYVVSSMYTHKPHSDVSNITVGSDIFAVFNHSDIEISLTSRNENLSDANLSYSSIGYYEKLLLTETSKSEYLTALLKKREKALLDRTKGQIAWLEIQKGQCRSKGLVAQISTIKKKQRAILLKMEKERDEIRRILKNNENNNNSDAQKNNRFSQLPDAVALKRKYSPSNEIKFNRVLKGFEVERGQKLEFILKKRESDLQKRREYVEKLVEWHKRLDKEEQDVLEMEKFLFKYHSESAQRSVSKKEQKILKINKSLKMLQSISASSDGDQVVENFVYVTGSDINKLWHRLTGRKEIRFDESGRYKLTKADLEKLYENAKKAVLKNFTQTEKMKLLLDCSSLNKSSKCNRSDDFLSMHTSNLSITSTIDIEREESKPLRSVENASADELNRTESGKTLTITPVTSSISVKAPEKLEEIHESISNDENNEISQILTKNSSAAEERNNNEGCFGQLTHVETELDTKSISTAADLQTIDIFSKISSTEIHSEDSKMAVIVDETNPTDSSLKEPKIVSEILSNFDDVKSTKIFTDSSEKISNETLKSTEDKSNTTFDAKEISSLSNAFGIETNESKHNTKSLLSDKTLVDISESIELQGSLQKSQTSPSEEAVENEDKYDDDFFESNTLLDDVTLPSFEDTLEYSQSAATLTNHSTEITESKISSEIQSESTSTSVVPSELEQRLIVIDESLKDLNETFERVLSPEKMTRSDTTTSSQHQSIKLDTERVEFSQKTECEETSTYSSLEDYENSEICSTKMPDIISEVEIRRQQLENNENVIKQIEHAVPYMFLREIPNKPPPPYVPPAHGSPMTTIFPSESRIRDITYRRTKELYNEIMRNDTTNDGPSVLDENITNIYERIIIDICKESMNEYHSASNLDFLHSFSFTKPLALYNPPDRIKCIQEFVYKRIRKVLGMDKKHSLDRNSILGIGRKKRDHVDEILIHELYEEEHKWINFDVEEREVRAAVVDEIVKDLIEELLDDLEKMSSN